MEKRKKEFVEWVKEHKTELIITGVSIAAIIAVIFGIKNHKELEEAWKSLRKVVEKAPKTAPVVEAVFIAETACEKDIVAVNIVTTGRIPHGVSGHLRNLKEGWKASPEKIATAAEHGYDLMPGQTWVEDYRTGGLAS